MRVSMCVAEEGQQRNHKYMIGIKIHFFIHIHTHKHAPVVQWLTSPPVTLLRLLSARGLKLTYTRSDSELFQGW